MNLFKMLLAESTILLAICGETLTEYLTGVWVKDNLRQQWDKPTVTKVLLHKVLLDKSFNSVAILAMPLGRYFEITRQGWK